MLPSPSLRLQRTKQRATRTLRNSTFFALLAACSWLVSLLNEPKLGGTMLKEALACQTALLDVYFSYGTRQYIRHTFLLERCAFYSPALQQWTQAVLVALLCDSNSLGTAGRSHCLLDVLLRLSTALAADIIQLH